MKKVSKTAVNYILLALIFIIYLKLISGDIDIRDGIIFLKEAAILSFAVIGVGILQIAGELNLCSGAQIAITITIAELFNNNYKMPGYIIVVITFVIAIALGLTIGLLSTEVGIPALVLTFAMEYVLRGISTAITCVPNNNEKYNCMHFLMYGSFLGIPCWLYFSVGIVAIVAIIMHCTYIGRCFYAVGNDSKAAARSGLPVKSVKLAAFLLGSILINISALFMISNLSFNGINVSSSTSVDVIAILCLAGVSLFGGKGNITGMIFGTIGFTIIVSFFYVVNVPGINLQMAKAFILMFTLWIQSKRKLNIEGAKI